MTTRTRSGKGLLAYNRGRNNRPAVLPTDKVDPEMLASEDFMKVDVIQVPRSHLIGQW